MKYKNELKLIYHFVLILILIVMQLVLITGAVAHEILALVFLIGLPFSVAFVFKQYAAAFKNARQKDNKERLKNIVKVVVIILIVVALIMLIVSGIISSEFIFSGIRLYNNNAWFTAYRVIMATLLGLAIILIALYSKEIVAVWAEKEDSNNDIEKDN